jgi:hypothetical protein
MVREMAVQYQREFPKTNWHLSPFDRAPSLSAALRAHVINVIQFPGDRHTAIGAHWLSAAGAHDNGQGVCRFGIHSDPEVSHDFAAFLVRPL